MPGRKARVPHITPRKLPFRASQKVPADDYSRVVVKDVHLPDIASQLLRGRNDLAAIGDVDNVAADFARGRELLDGGRELVRIHIPKRHPGPPAQEADGQGLAYAAGSARNQGDLVAHVHGPYDNKLSAVPLMAVFRLFFK